MSGWRNRGNRWLGHSGHRCHQTGAATRNAGRFSSNPTCWTIAPAAAWTGSGALTLSQTERAHPQLIPVVPPPPTTSSQPKGLRERVGPRFAHVICLEAPRYLGSVLSEVQTALPLRVCPPLPLPGPAQRSPALPGFGR